MSRKQQSVSHALSRFLHMQGCRAEDYRLPAEVKIKPNDCDTAVSVAAELHLYTKLSKKQVTVL